jgi:GNAT superfamily N-acetyltransferase
MSNVIIRKGRSEDLDAAMDLVMELAIFEKAPEAMVATKEMYQECFDNNTYDFNVATIDEKVVGMTLFYYCFSTWKGKMCYLEDFVVAEGYRSQGVGQMLFDVLIKEAKDNHCALVKWQVLDWNAEAIKFYQRQNVIIEDEWYNVKIIF